MKNYYLLLFCLITSYAAQAQTKEETITWLQEKIQNYIYFDGPMGEAENITVTVNECFIIINYMLTTTYSSYPNQYLIIPTAGVSLDKEIGMKNGIESIRYRTFDNNEQLSNRTLLFFVKSSEENLYERLQKAVDHLATFCPKKKETF